MAGGQSHDRQPAVILVSKLEDYGAVQPVLEAARERGWTAAPMTYAGQLEATLQKWLRLHPRALFVLCRANGLSSARVRNAVRLFRAIAGPMQAICVVSLNQQGTQPVLDRIARQLDRLAEVEDDPSRRPTVEEIRITDLQTQLGKPLEGD